MRGRLAIDVLSDDDLERIHRATLTVLERVGIAISSERILRALGDAGGAVDLGTGRVRFPAAMVEEAVARAPSRYVLAARDPALDLRIGEGNGYLSLDGCAAEIVDLDTGRRRPPTKADLVQATRLADAVEEVSYLWPCVAVTDVEPHLQAVHQTHAQLAHSTKHVTAMSTFSARDARAVVEMARVVAGGSEALRRRPIVSSFQCSISPLSYEGDVMEAAVEFAEAGLPCGFVAMAIGTATAPTTLAGHLVTVNAELLGGIVTLETLVPGAATYYGPYQAFMDLQSGGIDLAWGPEEFLFKLAAAQLARRYELPMNILGFGTGAKTQDWQAGAQHAIALMGIAVAGEADMIAATGTVYGSRVFAFENVLLDAELFDLTCHLLEGVRRGRRSARVRRDRGGRTRRALPRASAHARAHARAVDAAVLRPRHVGGMGSGRAARAARPGARARPPDPRRARAGAARRGRGAGAAPHHRFTSEGGSAPWMTGSPRCERR